MRRIINFTIGIILLAAAAFGAKTMIDNKQKPLPKVEKLIKNVFVERVENKTFPVKISANGNLTAAKKIVIFSEVQGVFVHSDKDFKTGEKYASGEVLIKIDNSEFTANLWAEKNNLYSLIASAMPDLKLDFLEAYPNWQNYLNQFDIHQTLKPLPLPLSEQEKYFLNAKNIFANYYRIKNLEERFQKYTLKAPFSGMLTEALVTKGTLITPGQKLGEFINTDKFELEVGVNKSYSDILKIGNPVWLYNLDKTQQWEGKIIRINAKIDAATQTIATFIEVKGNGLKEGEFLNAEFESKPYEEVIEVNRKLLIKNQSLFVVENEQLKLKPIEPVYFSENTVVVRGLKNGEIILKEPVPGAFEGMSVKALNL